MNNKCATGFARSGKDTFSKELAKHLDMELYALAQPIKDIICELFNWTEEHRDGSYKEIELLYSISPDSLDAAGVMYNKYMLDAFEPFHDCWEKLIGLFEIEVKENDLGYCVISPRRAFQLFGTEWGRALNEDIWLEIAPKTNNVITDVRFDNEATYFKARGAEVILIDRPGFKPVTNDHASENGVSERLIDLVVTNDSSKEALLETAREVADLYKR